MKKEKISGLNSQTEIWNLFLRYIILAKGRMYERGGSIMSDNYEKMLQLAKHLGYSSFTGLQKTAFRSEDVYDSGKDLFVIGETSSGKTLIPMLMYYAAYQEAREKQQRTPQMLFVVPYRALAAQKKLEIERLFQGEELDIVQSTGEYRQNDDEIQRGEVDIAVIITEKVYRYASRDSTFLSRYDFLVIDEIGLLNDNSRGIRIDFILAWAHGHRIRTGRPRILMLGTPFYSWEAYISKYGFTEIKADGRPVELSKNTILYHKGWGILGTEGADPCVRRCRLMNQARYDNLLSNYEKPSISCEFYPVKNTLCDIIDLKQKSSGKLFCPYLSDTCKSPAVILPTNCKSISTYVLSELCRYHLKEKRQILIFWNNREEVRRLCRDLYLMLRDVLPCLADGETCRQKVLDACDVNEDDVYGVLEDSTLKEDKRYIYYQALEAGIGFHSSSVPNELRTYIEHNLLEDTKLKIVCSTETLAFGVNSNVDVVIIADLTKQTEQGIRYLTQNEYQNYIGRAGRYSKSRQKTNSKGYVYTLVKKNQQTVWNELIRSSDTPSRLYSLFFQDANTAGPMFILNLFTDESSKFSREEIQDMIQTLPRPDGYEEERLTEIVRKALNFLVDKKLLQYSQQRLVGRGQKECGKRYCLTLYGSQMKGYILDSSDYDLVYHSIEEQTDKGIWQEIDIVTLLYRFLSSRHATECLGGMYTNAKAEVDLQSTYENLKARYAKGDIPEWLEKMNLKNDRQEKLLHILVGLMSWMDSDNPRMIFRNCKIHYSLLSKLAEQLAYLLEIGQLMLRHLLTEQWMERREQFRKFESFGILVDELSLEEEICKKEAWLQKIHCSLYYGIHAGVWEKFLSFLEASQDEGAAALADRLSPARINPETARSLRKAAVRYRFFERPSRAQDEDIEVRNNYRDQKRQYQKDVRNMGRYYDAFFAASFGENYTLEE